MAGCSVRLGQPLGWLRAVRALREDRKVAFAVGLKRNAEAIRRPYREPAADAEWHCEQRAPACVQQMSGRQISGIAATVHERLSLSARHALDDDARLVPAVTSYSFREGKKYGVTSRQELRAMSDLILVGGHE